ncbi:MAG: hypothetical protein KF819_25185 [Labilithrix sp.]|nr:hypothetical protein [Labilithrix sp.]
MNTATSITNAHEASSPAPARALEGLYAVAHALFEDGRLLEATRAFRVMIRLAPTDERAWLGLGACHERRDEDDVARELYGAGSLVAEPRSVRCLVALARVVRRAGDDDAARSHLEDALAIAESLGDEVLERLVCSELEVSP